MKCRAYHCRDEKKNEINDKRILSIMLGEYLLSDLTLSTRSKVKVEVGEYQRVLDSVVCIGGGVVFWIIANLRQPNNDRSVEQYFKQLNCLHVNISRVLLKACYLAFKNFESSSMDLVSIMMKTLSSLIF